MRKVPSLETVERDYSPKGVKFYYIYKSLAHPETNGYITPFTLEERLMHVARAKEEIGSRFQWLCDSMANDLKHALGDAPNSEFVVDPQGKILVARRWSEPDQLRDDLAQLLGEVDPPTQIADVGVKPLRSPKTAAKGVVPRIRLPGRMAPVQVAPLAVGGKDPFYVKLRAEVDQSFFRDGEGTLYLGFFLDPLYKVHWNNQVAPIEYEIKASSGLTITPMSAKGPTIKQVDGDADPREFLVDITGRSRRPIQVTVKYFACDDAETFCKPVTQHYEIRLQRDRDGGSRRGGGQRGLAQRFRRGGVRPLPGRRPRLRRPDPDAAARSKRLRKAVALFKKYDKDENGRINQQEWTKAKEPIAQADSNADGEISLKELNRWLKQNQKPDKR